MPRPFHRFPPRLASLGTRSWRTALVGPGLAGLLLVGGCVGSIGDGPGGGGTATGPGNASTGGSGSRPGAGSGTTPGTKPGGTPGSVTAADGDGKGAGPAAGDPRAAGTMPMRRLTATEYDNTIRDLLGDNSRPGKDLPTDRDAGFGFRRPGIVSTLESERLRDAAETLAAKAVQNLPAILTCTPASPADEAGCARKFAEQFGLRAYRRPLDATEIERLTALYNTGRTQLMLPFAEGIGLMLEAMLQSSAFLYRWELGPAQKPMREGDVIKLGPYEVASRLSYFLWSTMPDKELFDAAGANKLATAEDVAVQVRRMLESPKAKEGIGQFFEEWLALDLLEDRSKDPMIYPEFNDALKAAMLAETRGFVGEVMFGGDAKFSTLFSASFSMVDGALAKLYGAPAPAGGMQKVSLDPKQRAGLLTHASFLTLTGSPTGSDPTVRGKDIYLRMLCKDIPPPPPDVPPAKPASAGGTTRQRFEEHARNECASGCHQLFEPFGYALEHYDGIGKYREMDNGLPVDASGVAELDSKKLAFKDARDLGALISASPEAQRCFAQQWLRFAFRRAETDGDVASINAALDSFGRASQDVRELLVGLASSRTFRYRSPNPGEVLP